MRLILKILPALGILCFCTVPAFSQKTEASDTVGHNNPYKIDNRLYAIYRRADKLRASEQCLQIADTLKEESIRLGDKKAECLASVIKLFYFSRNRQLDSLQVWADKTREVARRNGYLQYYYQAGSQQSVTFINMLKFHEARAIIDKMHADALEDDYPYGLYCCYVQNAHFYNFQSNYEQSINYYVKAAEYMEENIPDQSPSTAYLQASDASIRGGMYNDALKYARKALDTYVESKTCINIYDKICIALFMLGEYDKIPAAYEDYLAAVTKYGANSKVYTNLAPILNDACLGQYDKALSGMQHIRDAQMHYLICEKIHELRGDYKSAGVCKDSILHFTQKTYKRSTDERIAEMSALLDNERLNAEKEKLELESQLSRRRTALILSITVFALLLTFIILSYIRSKKHFRELKKVNEAKDIFIRNMTHEVRTPLNAIVGFSQLLAEPDFLSDEEKAEYSRYVTDNGNMLAMLIDDILDTMDMEIGNYTINLKETDAETICKSAMCTSRTKLLDGVSMTYRNDIPEGVTFNTDPARMQQVLINVLNNACKNTVEGSIVLRSYREDGKICFSVTDTGCGIPEGKAEKIFERFYKIDEFKAGSGMGLSICRDITAKLNGDIKLDTSYGEGARFIIRIPG